MLQYCSVCYFCNSTGNSYNYHETLWIDQQWYCDHAVKFARWQHLAVGEVCCAWDTNCFDDDPRRL